MWSVWRKNCIYSITARGFKAGKENVTTSSPGLFGCKKIYFQTPFYGGQQVTVLASVGRSVKSQTHGNGAAVWVEDVKASEFTVCLLEFSNGSNNTMEVNYLAFQTTPNGSQTGTTSLNSWTTGTECKRIDFQQVRIRFLSSKQRDITSFSKREQSQIVDEDIERLNGLHKTQNYKMVCWPKKWFYYTN